MKILIEPSTKNNLYQDITTGIILSLDKYAVQSNVYFNLDEIKESFVNQEGLVTVTFNFKSATPNSNDEYEIKFEYEETIYQQGK